MYQKRIRMVYCFLFRREDVIINLLVFIRACYRVGIIGACFGKGRKMKRKMIVIGAAAIAAVALFFAGWYVMFMYFGTGPTFPFIKVENVDVEKLDQVAVADNSLIGEAETEEEALEIAKQYGIEFVSFENGLALYHTEEDPFEVVARGQENGYPQLTVNFTRIGYDTDKLQ